MMDVKTWEKSIAALVGKHIKGVAIVNRNPAKNKKDVILAQTKSMMMSTSEAQHVLEGYAAGNLHEGYISVNGTKYLVTTVSESLFNSKNFNVEVGGGISFYVCNHVFIVSHYDGRTLPAEVMPMMAKYGSEMVKQGA